MEVLLVVSSTMIVVGLVCAVIAKIMKKKIWILFTIIVIIGISGIWMYVNPGYESPNSNNNYYDSADDNGYKSKYDRDADYIGDQFGRSGDEVKDSVDRMAGAMH